MWACLSGFYLAERCKDLGIEHIHSPWASGPATAAWVVNYLNGIPFSFTARAKDVRPPDGFLQEKLNDCAFARSESSYQIPLMASLLSEEKRDKLHVTYNVRTLETKRQALMNLQEPYKLLAIGRLVEKKGYDYLIEAMALLIKEGIKVKLTIVGSGPWMKKLQGYIHKYNLEDHVHLAGFITHDCILEYIIASDIFVMPSVIVKKTGDSDGLPNVVIEAMSHALPVVASQIAGIHDIVKDGETGYLVPQRDAKALAEAISKMLKDKESVKHMGSNAKKLMDTMFDSEANLEYIRKLFCQYTPNYKTENE